MEPVRIAVRVTPRSGRDAVTSAADTKISVRVKAPPVDGAANAALIALVARAVGQPKSNVRVVGGASSRNKIVEIDGTDRAQVMSALKTACERAS